VFALCANLTSVVLPETLTTIGYGTFTDCTSLTSVNIPESVTYIGEGAFDNCPAPLVLNTPNLQTLKNAAFNNSGLVEIKSLGQITSIHSGSSTPFYSCKKLKKVTWSTDTVGIQGWQFRLCESLDTVIIPTETVVQLVEVSAFSGTHPDLAIYVTDNLVESYKSTTNWSDASIAPRIYPIGLYNAGGLANLITFADPAVESIVLANWDNGDGYFMKAEAEAVTSIGTVFQKNTTITSFDELFIHFTRVTSLAAYAFNECTSLKFNGIESTHITTIGQWAFRQCSPTTGKVVLPNLTSVGNQAFANTSIEEVLDLGRITQLSTNQWGAGVFSNCGQLTRVVLPETLTSIGYDPFAKCNSLQAIICKAVTPPTLGHQMALQSSDTNGCPIYVPDASVAEYQAATNWSSHTSRIKGISQLATDNPTLYAEIEEYL
jgi:hypothetical protein